MSTHTPHDMTRITGTHTVSMEDGSDGMEVVESNRDSWGTLLTMSVQDEGSTRRVGSQPGVRNDRSWSTQ